MTFNEVALAARMVLDAKGKPVTLHVRRLPGRTVSEVTRDIPTGRFHWAYETAGTYTDEITLRELRFDLRAAERELNERMKPGKWAVKLEIAA